MNCENCTKCNSLYFQNVGCCEMYDTLGECEFEPIYPFFSNECENTDNPFGEITSEDCPF